MEKKKIDLNNVHHRRVMYEWGLTEYHDDLKIRIERFRDMDQKRKKPTQKGSRLFRFLKGKQKEDTMTV